MREAPDGPRPLVIGIGTDDRSDDGIGLDVARSLAGRSGLDAEIREAPGDLLRLLDEWAGRPCVILVDAMRSGRAPGTIERWEDDQVDRMPPSLAVSTHGIGLADVLRLARDLGRRPPRVVVFGIEADDTAPGRNRSAACCAAVPRVGDRIVSELATYREVGVRA